MTPTGPVDAFDMNHYIQYRFQPPNRSRSSTCPLSCRDLTGCTAVAFWRFPMADDTNPTIEQLHDEHEALRKAHRELRESEERFALALDSTQDGLFDWDLRTNEIYYSPSWKRMLGYEDHEIANEFSEWERLTDPEDVQKAWVMLKEHLEGKRDRFELEFRMRHKDGHWVHVLSRASAVLDENGEAIRVVGTHVDITDRKRLEETLRQNEEHLSAIYNSSDIGIFVVTVTEDGRFIYAGHNPVHERLSGIANDQVVGKTPEDLVDHFGPKVVREVNAFYRECVRLKQPVEIEVLVEEGPGRGWWMTRLTPLLDEKSGRVVKLIGSGVKIDELKQAEAALRQSEEKYRQLAENTLDVIGVFDLDLVCTYVNSAVTLVTGHQPEDLIGRKLSSQMDEEQFARVSKIAATEIARGGESEGVVFETELLSKTGEPVPVEIRGWVLTDGDGNPVAIQGTTRDITERKQAEQERGRLEHQLRQSQKMEAVGRLAGGVAHDFNNLLTVIQGFSELVQIALGEGDPLGRDVAEIQKAADSAAQLTEQLLAFSRKQMISPKVVDLNKAVAQSTKMLQRIIGEDIEFVFDPGEETGRVLIDPGQVDQILVNLVVNSRDAMPDGGILTLETRSSDRGRHRCQTCDVEISGDYVVLEVSDTGEGIDVEAAQKIFEPFFTTKELGKGTGLGLSTIHGIVHQNNGHISVSSQPGAGASFLIYLPRVEAEPVTEADARDERPVRGHETVLVVEDQDMVRTLAVRTLQSQGYRVIEARSGGEALVIAEQHRGEIGLLLTDVIMPKMNGKQLYERLLAFDPHLKALFMSGYTDAEIAHHGILEEGLHFIPKPFKPQDLAGLVRRVLDSADG